MNAVSLVAKRKFDCVSIQTPAPADNEVLIRVKAVGICYTDVEMFNGTQPYFAMGLAHFPVILGHEWSGEIVETGRDAKRFCVGERVTGDVSIGCGQCRFCMTGSYNLCVVKQEVGLCRGKDGAFAEFLTMPERHVYALPKSVSYEEGAGVEPAATCVKAISKAGLSPGDSVLVTGDGTIGLLAVQAAKAFGAGLVIVSGNTQMKLKLARELGADIAVDVSKDNAVDVCKDATGGLGVDFAIEAAGQIPALRDCIRCVRMGGKLCVIGVYETPYPDFPAAELVVRDITFYGSIASPNAFPGTLRFLERGSIRTRPLITHEFKLSDARQAFEVMEQRSAERIKVLLRP